MTPDMRRRACWVTTVLPDRLAHEGDELIYLVLRPVEPRHLPGIFEPIKSGNHEEKDEQGTPSHLGLGLHIAREIVAAHGGSIGMTSIPEGKTFTVQLPRHNLGTAP